MISVIHFKKTTVCLSVLLATGLVIGNAWSEEAKPRTLTYYGKNGQWHACQKERLIRLEEDKDYYDEKELSKLIKRAEERGDDETIYLLSKTNKKGADGKLDLEFVSKWQKRALEIYHPAALFEAGEIAYRQGKISRDEFVKLAETAAEQHGGYDIPYRLALGYADPDTAPEGFDTLPANPEKALHWMKKAAERVNVAATDTLCSAFAEGNRKLGVTANPEEARKWCVRAAQADCSIDAPKHLARLFERGLAGLPRNALEIGYWKSVAWERANPDKVDKAADPLAKFGVVSRLDSTWGWPPCHKQRMVKTVISTIAYSDPELEEIKAQAEAGNAESMYVLAKAYQWAIRRKIDVDAVNAWRKKAAAAGHTAARFELETMGVEHNKADRDGVEFVPLQKDKISEEYQKLAETAAREHGGNGLAYMMAIGYYSPREAAYSFSLFPANPAKALYWMILAAERGNVAAAEHLCTAYYFGNNQFYGIGVDHAETRRWCVLAAPASCSLNTGYNLSRLFEQGIGELSRNDVDARYWDRISDDRRRSFRK